MLLLHICKSRKYFLTSLYNFSKYYYVHNNSFIRKVTNLTFKCDLKAMPALSLLTLVSNPWKAGNIVMLTNFHFKTY